MVLRFIPRLTKWQSRAGCSQLLTAAEPEPLPPGKQKRINHHGTVLAPFKLGTWNSQNRPHITNGTDLGPPLAWEPVCDPVPHLHSHLSFSIYSQLPAYLNRHLIPTGFLENKCNYCCFICYILSQNIFFPGTISALFISLFTLPVIVCVSCAGASSGSLW